LPRRSRPEANVIRADREARAELRRAARERRRYERAEVRRFTRRSRYRRAGLITAGSVALVLVAMLVVAVYSPILSLRTIDVRGTSRIDAEQVRAAVSDQLGTPLALLDFDEMTTDLGAFPLIRSFSTETVPPDTLVITVTEREPVGVMKAGEGWNLVDPAGVVVQDLPERPDDVPTLTVPNDSVDSEAFKAVIGVLLGLPDDMRARVGWIKATTSDDVTFGLPDVGQRVYWGSAERNEVKARVLTALITAQDKGSKVQYNVSSPDSPFITAISE
jgi:cell division protein FtsQ